MRIAPQLMFNGSGTSDAIDLWRRAFPDLEVVVDRTGEDGGTTQAEVIVAGQRLRLLDSPVEHAFTFTPSISLVVECETAEEVDRIVGCLSEGGTILMPLDAYDFSPRFAFLQDRVGVSWQVMQMPQ
jgi:predicted 3-demethylubiquinone-9 3-methyltransferase (glyoxalase superfamily)